MKKLFGVLTSLILMSAIAFAEPANSPISFDTSLPDSPRKVVGIFLEAPVTYVNNEKVRILVPEKAASLFPKSQYNVLPFDTTSMALRTYKEDNRMVVNQYYSKPVNRFDIQKIAKELKCDYALFIIVSNDAPRVSSGLFSISFKTTVTCDVRLLRVENAEYLISKQIVKDGQSTSIYMGVPSFDNAYSEALTKALNEITLDLSKL
jgi:hypothetical protein